MKKNETHQVDYLTLFRSFAKNEQLNDLEFGIVCVFLHHNLNNKVVDGDALTNKLGLSKVEMVECLRSLIKKGVLEEAGKEQFYLVGKV